MSKLISFAEAIVRFGPLVTTGIEIEDAIQEAVDRVFEMGRWPGTTQEVELLEADFVESDDGTEWYYSFDEATYDGAIGFRNGSRGWSIVDQTALYKDGVNMGDREWVDLGTITVDGVDSRKYRAPLGFVPSAGPYYALMKLEAPTLGSDDLIPIQSVAALKSAILAVSWEYAGDMVKAQSQWQMFDQFIKLSERQVAGPKRFTIGMDSSLRRSPRQFH